MKGSVSDRRILRMVLGLLGAMLVGILGCVSLPTRFQAPEDAEKKKDLDIRTIGDITTVSNAVPMPVSGVGLVTGLRGTGHSPPGTFRTMLENDLRKQGKENVRQLLDSPNNALVLVSGVIMAGARKGEPLDIDVTLPPGSKGTSLRGGYLQKCNLVNFDSRKHLSPQTKKPDGILLGHSVVHAEGPLLVGFGGVSPKGEQGELRESTERQGRIWSGGVSHIPRPFFLTLNKDQQFARVSNAVAERINFMFPNDTRRHMVQHLVLDDVAQKLNHQFTPERGPMAKAYNREVVYCNVPYIYRFNPPRFLRVARLIPLRETPEKMTRYRRRLEKMLLDPAETIRTALRLEALGKESIPALQKGLESEHALVRFASAESLAYLGSTTGCQELARLAIQHPLLRSYGLLALASLEEGVCRQLLADMLLSDDAELRCGAFKSLCLIDEYDKRLNGRNINNSYWLHRLAPGSVPLVFFSVRQRAEVVLFGSDISLVPPFAFQAGPDYVIAAYPHDDRCTISHIIPDDPRTPPRRQCSLHLEDVLETLGKMGGGYPEAVDLLNKAQAGRSISCPVSFKTLPQDVSVETLAQGGRSPDFLKEVQ